MRARRRRVFDRRDATARGARFLDSGVPWAGDAAADPVKAPRPLSPLGLGPPETPVTPLSSACGGAHRRLGRLGRRRRGRGARRREFGGPRVVGGRGPRRARCRASSPGLSFFYPRVRVVLRLRLWSVLWAFHPPNWRFAVRRPADSYALLNPQRSGPRWGGAVGKPARRPCQSLRARFPTRNSPAASLVPDRSAVGSPSRGGKPALVSSIGAKAPLAESRIRRTVLVRHVRSATLILVRAICFLSLYAAVPVFQGDGTRRR